MLVLHLYLAEGMGLRCDPVRKGYLSIFFDTDLFDIFDHVFFSYNVYAKSQKIIKYHHRIVLTKPEKTTHKMEIIVILLLF